jgi:beta-xylosidase
MNMALLKLSHLIALSTSIFCILAPTHASPSGKGPVIDINFPDPTIISVDGIWYAFATNDQNEHINVQIASSKDFSNWTVHDHDALPTLPDWAVEPWTSQVWAPDVNETVRFPPRSKLGY